MKNKGYIKVVIDNDRPTIVINDVMHVMDIDTARNIRDELTDVIKRSVIAEAVRLNKHGEAVARNMEIKYPNLI